MLSINTNKNGSTLDIALEGLLDTKTAPDLEKEVMDNLDGVTEINFEFADLEYLTSAGLRVLLEAQQEMDDREGTMTLKNVSDDIMEIFEMTGFSDVLTIV